MAEELKERRSASLASNYDTLLTPLVSVLHMKGSAISSLRIGSMLCLV